MPALLIARFDAPWSGALWLTSSVASVALVVVEGLALSGAGPMPHWLRVALPSIAPLALALAAAFAVRGYGLTAHAIEILRPGWSTVLPLAGLESIEADAQALRGSRRILGNGGLFSFTGWYRSSRLGSFRAYATDPARAVVLRYPGRTVVLTPAEPGRFIAAVRGLVPHVNTRGPPHA